jgi:hypothetical protein
VITGAVRELIVDNRLTAMTARYVGLRLDDGHNVVLRSSGLETLAQGTRVEATGQLGGDTLFATGFRLLAGSATPSGALIQAEGTLAVVHSDNFDQGRSAYSWVIRGAGESATPLQLVAMPSGLDIVCMSSPAEPWPRMDSRSTRARSSSWRRRPANGRRTGRADYQQRACGSDQVLRSGTVLAGRC